MTFLPILISSENGQKWLGHLRRMHEQMMPNKRNQETLRNKDKEMMMIRGLPNFPWAAIFFEY